MVDLDPTLNVLGHLASATGGGITVGWIAKVMIQNWIQKHQQLEQTVKTISDSLIEIKAGVAGLARIEQRTLTLERVSAILEERVAGIQGIRFRRNGSIITEES